MMLIDLSDGTYDALSTTYDGLIENVRGVRFSNDPDGYSDGILNIKIEGDSENASIVDMEFGMNSVKAAAFANLAHGLIRAGLKPQDGYGEVAVVMVLEASVPVSTMARASITVTEGITSAIQDLGLRYDAKTASGSCKQNIVIVRKRDSSVKVRGAGNHCKLGELIGASTIEAVKLSAEKNGVDAGYRQSITRLMSEYGLSKEYLMSLSGSSQSPGDYDIRDSDGVHLASVSAILHIEDCIRWGLIPRAYGTMAGNQIISSCFGTQVSSENLLDSLASSVSHYLFDDF